MQEKKRTRVRVLYIHVRPLHANFSSPPKSNASLFKPMTISNQGEEKQLGKDLILSRQLLIIMKRMEEHLAPDFFYNTLRFQSENINPVMLNSDLNSKLT